MNGQINNKSVFGRRLLWFRIIFCACVFIESIITIFEIPKKGKFRTKHVCHRLWSRSSVHKMISKSQEMACNLKSIPCNFNIMIKYYNNIRNKFMNIFKCWSANVGFWPHKSHSIWGDLIQNWYNKYKNSERERD